MPPTPCSLLTFILPINPLIHRCVESVFAYPDQLVRSPCTLRFLCPSMFNIKIISLTILDSYGADTSERVWQTLFKTSNRVLRALGGGGGGLL